MRNVFIALLVVNLVYFVWAHWVDEPSMPPVNEALARLPRLKLLSELPPEQRPPTATRTVLDDGSSCMSVGPFDDITSAAKAAAILTGKGFAPQLRAEEAGEGYWVYVGGLKDAVAANKARISGPPRCRGSDSRPRSLRTSSRRPFTGSTWRRGRESPCPSRISSPGVWGRGSPRCRVSLARCQPRSPRRSPRLRRRRASPAHPSGR